MDPWTLVVIGLVAGGGVLLVLREKAAANAAASELTAESAAEAAAAPPPASASTIAAESLANANSTQTSVSEAESTIASVAGDAATGNIAGAAVSAVSGLVSELTQHSARLQGAKQENEAADTVVPAFDADIKAINGAYLAGEITVAQVKTLVVQVLTNCYNSLYALVGKPGTAWTGNASQAAAGLVPCDKSCTVSCCLYWNDLWPAIYGAKQFANGQVGIMQAVVGAAPNAPLNGGGAGGPYFSYVPEVYPPDDPAYGTFSRPAYTLNWKPPAKTPISTVAHTITTAAKAV